MTLHFNMTNNIRHSKRKCIGTETSIAYWKNVPLKNNRFHFILQFFYFDIFSNDKLCIFSSFFSSVFQCHWFSVSGVQRWSLRGRTKGVWFSYLQINDKIWTLKPLTWPHTYSAGFRQFSWNSQTTHRPTLGLLHCPAVFPQKTGLG